MKDSAQPEPPRPGCPICGADRAEAFRPFCSLRCADIDLGRWMTGAYAAPAEEAAPPNFDGADGLDDPIVPK